MSVKCILINYNEETKWYKLFNLITNKLIVSCDVIFNADEVWAWEDNGGTHDNVDEGSNSLPLASSNMDSTIDSPPRKVRNLYDIYAKPTCFEDIVTREK